MSTDRYDFDDQGVFPLNRECIKLIYVSTARYDSDWLSTMHTHAYAEIFYVIGGSGQFKIEELTRTVYTDDMVIVNPYVEHTEISLNANPLEYIVLGIEGLAFSLEADNDDRFCVVDFRNERVDILHYLRCLLSEIMQKPVGYNIVCQDILEVLLIRLFRQTLFSFVPGPPKRGTSRVCATVRRYIDTHFKEHITLDLLAEIAHFNKFYMVHAFTEEYGISPINYLISRRIEESKHLLSDTGRSLSQISNMLGFSSPGYFSQSFRKVEGISPMEFRKQCQQVKKTNEHYSSFITNMKTLDIYKTRQ